MDFAYTASNYYEAYPDPIYRDFLLDIFQDLSENMQIRLRCLMALKTNQTYLSNYFSTLLRMSRSDPGFRQEMASSFLGTLLNKCHDIKSIHYSAEEISLKVVTLLTSHQLAEFIADTICISDLRDTRLYKFSKVIWSNYLSRALTVVPPKYKLTVAELLATFKLLSIDHCNHLLEQRRMIGNNVYDFFASLRGAQFARFSLIGRNFITLGDEPADIRVDSQSVHQLDRNRQDMLKWLVDRRQEEESDIDCTFVDLFIDRLSPECKQSVQKIQSFGTSLEVFHPSLNRILRLSLYDVCRKIIQYILNHPLRTELEVRLKEELEEMAGTCFSGHLNRLFNVFVGFEDSVLNVSPEEVLKHFTRSELDESLNSSVHKELLLNAIVMADFSREAVEALREVVSKVYFSAQRKLGSEGVLSPDLEQAFWKTVELWSGTSLEPAQE